LYGGTSGIALFLAELGAATGAETLRKTALGAIRQSLMRETESLGLYSGRAGIGLAAARIGRLFGVPELLEQARQHARSTASKVKSGRDVSFDIIDGLAGMIDGFLVLDAVLEEPSLVEAARSLGDQLVASAVHDRAGVSWRTHGRHWEQNLTGLSHGASGAAGALLELSRATGEQRYLEIARGSFEYERLWFDQLAGNWPDFRDVPRRGRRAGPIPGFLGWCHGAPGIGLIRLRAFEVLQEDRFREEARVALETTLSGLTSGDTEDFSLCHGRSGLMSIVVEASRSLGETRWANAAMGLAACVTAKHSRGSSWPLAYDNPGLMLGKAGIGYCLLEMARNDVPSVLLFQPALS
jgi:lantibiotic modifying enzyme